MAMQARATSGLKILHSRAHESRVMTYARVCRRRGAFLVDVGKLEAPRRSTDEHRYLVAYRYLKVSYHTYTNSKENQPSSFGKCPGR